MLTNKPFCKVLPFDLMIYFKSIFKIFKIWTEWGYSSLKIIFHAPSQPSFHNMSLMKLA